MPSLKNLVLMPATQHACNCKMYNRSSGRKVSRWEPFLRNISPDYCVNTLYRLCCQKTVALLRNTFWNECPFEENPFALLPTSVVDDLLKHALELVDKRKLKLLDIQLLLSSGRVTEFELTGFELYNDDLAHLLLSLNPEKLRHLVLNNLFFCCWENKGLVESEALQHLLGYCHELRVLHSSIEFDLRVLENCSNLTKLSISVYPDFTSEEFIPLPQLRDLEISEDIRNPIPAECCGAILRRYPQLESALFNIASGLEWLHGDEFSMTGTVVDVTYQLKRCLLGTASKREGAATGPQVRLVTALCPNLSDVFLLTSQHEALLALCEAKHLRSLQLQWEAPEGGDFRLGAKGLLKKIGAGLEELYLLHFRCVDFVSVATSCPNLRELDVEFMSEVSEESSTELVLSFLETLCLENTNDITTCFGDTLTLLLRSETPHLRTLTLKDCSNLNDQILESIIDSLVEVREATLSYCSLSATGVTLLASRLPHLRYLELSSHLVSFEEVADVVHSLNPSVVIQEPARWSNS